LKVKDFGEREPKVGRTQTNRETICGSGEPSGQSKKANLTSAPEKPRGGTEFSSTGKHDPQRNVFKVNQKKVEKMAKQLSTRGVGGETAARTAAVRRKKTYNWTKPEISSLSGGEVLPTNKNRGPYLTTIGLRD